MYFLNNNKVQLIGNNSRDIEQQEEIKTQISRMFRKGRKFNDMLNKYEDLVEFAVSLYQSFYSIDYRKP
jgi:Mg2+ and Co2+ transporter CorA